LQEKYRSETVPALMKRFGWKNMMAVPKLRKSRSTSGWAKRVRTRNSWTPRPWNSARSPAESRDHPAKKSIANFKIRKGMPIGCAVICRGDHMRISRPFVQRGASPRA